MDADWPAVGSFVAEMCHHAWTPHKTFQFKIYRLAACFCGEVNCLFGREGGIERNKLRGHCLVNFKKRRLFASGFWFDGRLTLNQEHWHWPDWHKRSMDLRWDLPKEQMSWKGENRYHGIYSVPYFWSRHKNNQNILSILYKILAK
jgi:hypothetical protein